MPVTALPGRLYFDPTSALVGGTLIGGVDERRHVFDQGRRTRIVRRDFEAIDSFDVVVDRGDAPRLRLVPLEDSTEIARMLFGLVRNSAGDLISSGGVPDDFGNVSGFSLVLRPFDTSQPLLYGPAWKLHPDSTQFLVWHPTEPYFEGSELVLLPTGDSPTWMLADAEAIDAEWFDEEEGEL